MTARKPKPLRWQSAAYDDLREIVGYIAADSTVNALSVESAIVAVAVTVKVSCVRFSLRGDRRLWVSKLLRPNRHDTSGVPKCGEFAAL